MVCSIWLKSLGGFIEQAVYSKKWYVVGSIWYVYTYVFREREREGVYGVYSVNGMQHMFYSI